MRTSPIFGLALAGVLLMGVETLRAAPILFFLNQPTAAPQELITDIGVPFAIEIGTDGSFSRLYQNVTGALITDFHFSSSAPEEDVWEGGGGAPPPFFQLVSASPDRMSINFYQGPFGTGIAPGQVFEITGIDFIANRGTRLIAIATVPEPSALLLCCISLLTIIIGARRVHKLRSLCQARHT
jgi:hypothetical protein